MTDKLKVNLIAAIKSLDASAEVAVHNENIDTIEWHNGTTEIAKADILAEQKRLQDIEDAK
tara:strand:- start:655 stop:837 length:183 start_codon:yes stop_codon:yes gene_type:complete